MSSLRLASFGMRGHVGTSLTPRVVIDFTNAFASYLGGGRVLLGRDTRYSSSMIHDAALASLLSSGCEVIDLGICPTPVIQFCVNSNKADGAISISGGHNSQGWNTLTLIDSQGALMEPMGGENVLELFHAGDFKRCDWKSMGHVVEAQDFFTPYLDALEQQINGEAIRSAGFTVLIDPVGGAGCAYLEPFAKKFNLKLLPINAEPSGYLAREAEPRPRSALQMAGIIGHVKGDVGFLHSSDMGRMSLVSENGEPVSEEYTSAVIANHVLSKKTGPLITNCCSTLTLDKVAERWKAPVIKTRVGQPYVVSALADEQGVMGGEGTGSVVLPSFSRAYDGFLMMALVLEAMAERGEPLSALLNDLQRFHVVKKDIHCGLHDAFYALEGLRKVLSDEDHGKIDLTDGIRVDWEDSWMHARPSRTHQTIRIISESADKELARKHAQRVARIIEEGIWK